MQDRKSSRNRSSRRFWRAVVLLLVVAAVVQELRKDPDEREWHGTVFGFVPYDLRPPTVERVKSAMWSPDDPRLLKPHAFGVGWTLNVGRLVRLIRDQSSPRHDETRRAGGSGSPPFAIPEPAR